ncbi:uncharacterized protein LOC119337689 isoform X2 [Triticum dicoccoides]|uniref:uncharacterized protein LOC119337689 isoform X2 n=1 Tax=Triticum dicoccoides TaxID=85692 RepID=UPI0018918B06|nr:uncharacterized protein LOC119337689 isoform X2 [Triticum dicoccoides]
MQPYLSISPMLPDRADEVRPRPDPPRPPRAFQIRAVVELDPRPARHTMADVLKATSMDDIDDKDEEEDDHDMRDPTPEPDELDEEMSSPTSSSTMTASSSPTMTMRHRRA